MRGGGRISFGLHLLGFWFARLFMVWLLIGLLIFLMQIAICGIIHDSESVKSLLNMIDMLPRIVKSALGGEGLQAGNLPSLIAIGYNHPLVLTLFLLFAVGIPTGMLAGEVQRGTMELILSRSTTKSQVYICAGIITVGGMFALVIVMFLGTVVATTIYDFGEPIPLYRFFQLAINAGLLATAIGAISLLCAASFRRRGKAVGVAVGYIMVNYFASIITEWWPKMAWLDRVTIFNYVGSDKIFGSEAWPVGDMAVLAAVFVAAFIAGAIIWQRRDLPL